MTKGKVLIIDDIHPVLREQLKEMNYEVTHKKEFTREEVKELIVDCVGLIVRSRLQIDKDLLSCAPDLKFIGRTGSGMELIDTEYAAERGIVCINSPEGNRDAVAEHAIGMMLSLVHHIDKSNREMRNGNWFRKENVGTELGHKTVAILGMGNTGTAVAKRVRAFGCKVLAYDAYKTNFNLENVEEVGLERIFEEAEVVSLHFPLYEGSYHYCNDAFLEKFANPIVLINTARGPIADLRSMARALESGKVIGLGLDVFENEPTDLMPEEYRKSLEIIAQHEHSILSPHVAGLTNESYYKVAYFLGEKVRRIT